MISDKNIMAIDKKLTPKNQHAKFDDSVIKIGNVKKVCNIKDYEWLEFSDTKKIEKYIDSTDEYIFFLHYVSGEKIDSLVIHESNLNSFDIFACTISKRKIFYYFKNSEKSETLLEMVYSICKLIDGRNEASVDFLIDSYNILIQEECARIDKKLIEISITNF